MSPYALPLINPFARILSAGLSVGCSERHYRLVAIVAGIAAFLALAVAWASVVAFVFPSAGESTLFGDAGIGLSTRLYAVSVTMLVLVAFVGWTVVRYSFDANAGLLAGLLKEPKVRAGLAERGVNIPDYTLFLGALHDTTTDRVTVYETDHPSSKYKEKIESAKTCLEAADQQARSERALRLARATGPNNVVNRSGN